MSFLSNLTVYAGNWEQTGSQKFDANDLAAIDSATVVTSQFGKSVCFFLKGGGQSYVPMSRNGQQLEVGASVDPSKVTIETLSKKGEADIYRARID